MSGAAESQPPSSPKIDVDLTDCLLNHMDISVSEAEKRTNSALNIRESYTVYLIETRITDNGWELIEHGLGQIWRRYSEFEQLRQYMSSAYPWAVIPPLPEKKHSYPVHGLSTDTFDPDFVDRRRAGLENFLHRIAQHPSISRDSMFLTFLQQEEGWRNSIRDKGYVRIAEDKIKAINAIVRIKESDPDFESLRKYSHSIQGVFINLLRIRSRATLKVYNIHKLNAGYGKLFSEWSAIEKQMGDGLQQAGHFFDSIAANTETFVEEEEQIMDQIKEYLFYASSLEDICNKRDMIQLEIEQMVDLVRSKTAEKAKAAQGKFGVITRILGSVETEENKTQKVNQLDSKIKETEERIHQARESMAEYKDKATKDIEAFKRQQFPT
uniref:Sorting nexin-4 n=1 Tax=Lygus hesperus TaxID=30085 RepID=A0A0A9W7E4_LYGHE